MGIKERTEDNGALKHLFLFFGITLGVFMDRECMELFKRPYAVTGMATGGWGLTHSVGVLFGKLPMYSSLPFFFSW